MFCLYSVDKTLPDRPFHNFRASRWGDRWMFYVVQKQRVKLQNCERVGRGEGFIFGFHISNLIKRTFHNLKIGKSAIGCLLWSSKMSIDRFEALHWWGTCSGLRDCYGKWAGLVSARKTKRPNRNVSHFRASNPAINVSEQHKSQFSKINPRAAPLTSKIVKCLFGKGE